MQLLSDGLQLKFLLSDMHLTKTSFSRFAALQCEYKYIFLHLSLREFTWVKFWGPILGSGWKGGVFVPTKISYRHQTVFANKHIWKTSVPTKNILKTWNSPCQPENFKNFKKPVPTKNSPKTSVHGDQNIIKNIKQYMLKEVHMFLNQF